MKTDPTKPTAVRWRIFLLILLIVSANYIDQGLAFGGDADHRQGVPDQPVDAGS